MPLTDGDEERVKRYEAIETASALLDSPLAKVALSALILLSVLPFGLVDTLALPLGAIFAAEFGVRVLLWRRARRLGIPTSVVDALGLVADLVALATFLPIPAHILGIETRTLRLLRLLRLVLLFRYSASGARTLYEVLVRRERLRQLALVTTLFSLLAVLGAVLVHHLGVEEDFDGDAGTANAFLDTVWWCVRQLESPDNLVRTIRSDPLLIGISLALTLAGVFLVAFVIGIGQSVMEQLFAAEATRPVTMRSHTVLLGPVERAEVLVRQVVLLFHKNRDAAGERLGIVGRLRTFLRRRREPVALLGGSEHPPGYLFEQGMSGVVYRRGDPTRVEELGLANVAGSRRVIVLSDPAARDDADAIVVSTALAARRASPATRIFAEVHRDESAAILKGVAGDRTYPLEASRFLGLFLAQHLTVPGVDRLYEETFGVEGSEFYTHMAIRPSEFRALDALAGQGAEAAFSSWVLDAHQSRVLICGVFLGDPQPRRAVPVERLSAWLNPLGSSTDPRIARLGGAAGLVPLAPLRGFVALCPSYATLATWTRRLLRGEVRPPPARPPRDLPFAIDDGRVSRILVLGDNAALPAFLREMARRRKGLRAVVATETGPSVRRFEQRIAKLPRITEERRGETILLEGENGSNTSVVGMEELSLRRLVRDPALAGPPFDAVVFLSDPAAPDPDARTSFRVLRFLRRIEDGTFALGAELHVLAEIGSASTAAGIEAHLTELGRKLRSDGKTRLRYTILSTDVMKNYFLAHGALIPGLIGLYDELLGEDGPEIVRLVVSEDRPWSGGEVAFSEIIEALAPRRLIPLALEIHGEKDLLVNPSPRLRLPATVVRAVYALGEAKQLSG